MVIATLAIALFVASIAALIYGYNKNDRRILLGAGVALFISGVFGDLAYDFMSEFPAGLQAGWKAGSQAAAKAREASSPQGGAVQGK